MALTCWLLGHRYQLMNIKAHGVFVVFDVRCARCGKVAR